jgi:hypothetical protein
MQQLMQQLMPRLMQSIRQLAANAESPQLKPL